MRAVFAALLVTSVLAPSAAFAAAPCKDAKGKFIACPKPAPAQAKRCKGANGKFVKCGAPGAKPV